jgi:hypothetical protein
LRLAYSAHRTLLRFARSGPLTQMRRPLTLHPQSLCDAVSLIEVEITRRGPGHLSLTYVVTGAIADLSLPPPAAPGRSDDLWKHTCFETFVRPPGEAYFEFNFSPSSHWAAYRFSGYRSGMSAPAEAVAPLIETRASRERFELQVDLSLAPLLGLSSGAPWRLGLSVVIEETSGRKSYWALTHPAGKADFHHADGFALDLPPPEHP